MAGFEVSTEADSWLAFGGKTLAVQMEQDRIEVRLRLAAASTCSHYDVPAVLDSSAVRRTRPPSILATVPFRGLYIHFESVS